MVGVEESEGLLLDHEKYSIDQLDIFGEVVELVSSVFASDAMSGE